MNDPTPEGNIRRITVSDFDEYMSAVTLLTDGAPDTAFYRGQSNAAWPVDCSAARRLREQLGIIDDSLLQLPLFAYINMLEQRARNAIGGEGTPNRVELLAQLQHNGAATHLIDFTECPIVALWFACSERPNAHRTVYLLEKSMTSSTTIEDPATQASWYKGDILRRWKPNPSPRVSRQQSVFVFGSPVLRTSRLRRIVILAAMKPRILEQLAHRDEGITRSWLFPDIPGVADQNKVNRPIDEDDFLRGWDMLFDIDDMDERTAAGALHIDGMMYAAFERHTDAVLRYDESLRIREHSVAYNSRGLSKKVMGDLHGALADFDAAIALEPESGLMHFNRAQVLLQLERTEEGKEAYELAIQYGYNPFSPRILWPSGVP